MLHPAGCSSEVTAGILSLLQDHLTWASPATRSQHATRPPMTLFHSPTEDQAVCHANALPPHYMSRRMHLLHDLRRQLQPGPAWPRTPPLLQTHDPGRHNHVTNRCTHSKQQLVCATSRQHKWATATACQHTTDDRRRLRKAHAVQLTCTSSELSISGTVGDTTCPKPTATVHPKPTCVQ